MTLILFLLVPFVAYWICDFLCRDGPQLYFAEEPRNRRERVHHFVRSGFAKLSQRQVRKNDRRLFAAGDKHAFA